MKKFFLLILIAPGVVFAQSTKRSSKTKTKTKSAKISSVPKNQKTGDEFVITGNITGLANGASVQMLNGSTGAQEQTTTVQNGKFTFKGKAAAPDFKVISPTGQPPFITVFADNSTITINAKSDDLANAEIKGSPAHDDFAAFNKVSKPYEDLISGKGRFDTQFMDEGAAVLETFIKSHPASYITPLVIFRYNQVTADYAKLEEMYNGLNEKVKASTIGNYLRGQIIENQTANYGQPIAEFSQADTAGKAISLSAFKGKYVLVDFWASWCGPCRAENPNVVNTFEKYKNKNFTVLGVSLDRAKQPWIDAIAQDGLNWTQVSDLQFWNNAVAQQFGIKSIPQNFLLDPEGKLVAKNLRGAALEYRLSKLLK